MLKKTAPTDTSALYFNARLLTSLSAIQSSPLTIIEAPMGYGKTVAVREFFRKHQVRALWVPVLGASPDAFWRDFCRMIERSFPLQERIAEALSRLGYPYDSVRAAEARHLLSDLNFSRKTALVIDDYHLLPDQGFGAFCELLAREGNSNLRIVLITRDSYAGNRNLLELKGALAHVGREFFSLTPEEIREYYARCGAPVDEKDARLLHAGTGGWISALYLHLLLRVRGDELDWPCPVNALVEKEIYAPLSPGAKELLFSLYPLERFTAEQAAFVHGGGHTGALLDELCRKNSFVAFDEVGRFYAIHGIFKQYIEELFSRLPMGRQRKIHSMCGDWFAREGEIASAAEAYYRAGDFEEALCVLESDMSRNLVTERASFFVDLFRACPEEILDRHLPAAFKYAIAAYCSGEFALFGAQCGWLAKKCAIMPDSPETDAWRGELEFLRSLAAYNDIKAMSSHHRRANALLGRPTRLFGPDSPWTLGCPSVLFMFHRESGKLENELQLMKECLPHYYQLAANHGAGGEYLMEAEALYNAGDFENSAVICHKAEAMALRHSQLGNLFCALFLHLRLALVRGDFSAAKLLIEEMRGLIKKNRDYFLLYTADLCEGWLYAILGLNDKIPAWLRADFREDTRLYAFAKGFYYLTHGRALLLAGQYARTLGLFSYLLEADVFSKNLLFSIYARIYTAAALQGMGRGVQAAEALQGALEAALPDRLYMPFSENFDLIRSVLERSLPTYAASSPLREGVERIMGLGVLWERQKNTIVARHFSSGGVSLTRRELEMARLGANGKPFKEIADILNIAPATVKRAFANMYKKLGLKGRDELGQYLASQGLGGLPAKGKPAVFTGKESSGD